MELVLAVAALIVALIALGLAIKLQSDLGQARETSATAVRDAAQAREAATVASQQAAQAQAAAREAERGLTDLRAQFTPLQEDLARLRNAVEAPPPPPLPQARRRDLGDLRERLRAEQETASDDEAET